MRKIFLAVLALSCGCEHKHPESRAGAPEEEKTLQVTVWDNGWEVFYEHSPVVAGRVANFATHVTDLRTFLPRREGRATFVLRIGEEAPLEHVEGAPSRPGIYGAQLTFPKAGKWSLSLLIPGETAVQRVELRPVIVHESLEAARKAEAPDPPAGVSFLKEQQWKLGTRIEPVARRRLVERLRLPGAVSARPGSRASVTAPVEGRLLVPVGKSLPGLGDRVEAGQVLALVQPPFSEFAAKLVEANVEVVKSKLAQDAAEQSLARTRNLHAAQAKTERELQESELAFRTAQAQHQGAVGVRDAYQKAGAVFTTQEGKDLPALELRAPISGRVVEVRAAVGEHVGPEHPLLTILDAERVYVEARIPETDVGRVSSARGAAYESMEAKGRPVAILGEGGGRVVYLGLEVDPSSRTIPLVYEVPNPGGHLRIGMTLTVFVETAREEQSLAVPASALVDEEGRYVAFVQTAGETFEKRDLTLGIRDTGFAQVLSGLAEGERVVTHGAYAVRLASVATSLPAHGHAH